jgi:hypothetical protein
MHNPYSAKRNPNATNAGNAESETAVLPEFACNARSSIAVYR